MAVCEDAPTTWSGYSFAQLTLGSTRRFRAAITASKFFNATGGVHEFLLAGEKRMTSGADTDFNIVTGRAGMIDGAARANDVGFQIFRMYVRFHVSKGARNLYAPVQIRKS
jgi:hypothetical protein